MTYGNSLHCATRCVMLPSHQSYRNGSPQQPHNPLWRLIALRTQLCNAAELPATQPWAKILNNSTIHTSSMHSTPSQALLRYQPQSHESPQQLHKVLTPPSQQVEPGASSATQRDLIPPSKPGKQALMRCPSQQLPHESTHVAGSMVARRGGGATYLLPQPGIEWRHICLVPEAAHASRAPCSC
eukprot:848902-Pelagomonas_calceolata.AAC.2